MAALRIILPAAAIALTLALFLQLAWPARAPIPRRTSRRGGIGIAVLTAVYAVAAFTGLGSARDPQHFCTLEAGESATLALDGVHSIGTVWYYTGLYTGEYTLAYSDDGITYTAAGTMPQGYADLFKWLQPQPADTAPATAAYVRITASAHLELGELALYDAQGERIAVREITGPATAAALCDEADTVPASSTYYNSSYFDEIYHARTAYEHLRGVYPYEVSHPPLGKEILSLGIRLFGMTPLGWRFMGTLFGACGVTFGIGAATKWTCLYAGAGLGVLWVLHWVFSGVQAHRDGDGRRYVRRLLGNIGFCLVFFVLVPGMIYYASYYPYGAARGLHGAGMYFTREYAAIVLENQRFMFTYHAGLVATHPYSSRWWQWLLDLRPILYYLSYGDGTVSTIGAFVNPLLCWGGLLALPVLVYHAAKRERTALFILVGYLAQVLPWVFISRLTFEYHYFAATLFLVLALGYVFDRLRQRGSFGIVYAFTAASGALLALFYPVLTGVTVSRSYAWNVLKWLPDWPF